MTDSFEDVGAYLLGALSPDEVASFERAMETDPALRAEVEHLRVAADALPASPIQIMVPPDLKGRIMAVVESEAQLLRAAGPAADRPPSPVRPRRRAVAVLRPGWWSLRPGVAALASMAVLAVGIVGGVVASGGDSTKQVAAIHGHAKLIVRSDGHSTLTATKLDPTGPNSVYQVWLQSGSDKPEPTNALFGARKDGTASVDVPGDLAAVDKVLVTREPAGGSESPTTAPIIELHPA